MHFIFEERTSIRSVEAAIFEMTSSYRQFSMVALIIDLINRVRKCENRGNYLVNYVMQLNIPAVV